MLKIILLLIPISWGAVQQVDLAKQSSEVEFFAVGKPRRPFRLRGTEDLLITHAVLKSNVKVD